MQLQATGKQLTRLPPAGEEGGARALTSGELRLNPIRPEMAKPGHNVLEETISWKKVSVRESGEGKRVREKEINR